MEALISYGFTPPKGITIPKNVQPTRGMPINAAIGLWWYYEKLPEPQKRILWEYMTTHMPGLVQNTQEDMSGMG